MQIRNVILNGSKIHHLIPLIVTTGLLTMCGPQKSADRTVNRDSRIFDRADLMMPQQEDSVFSLISTLEADIGSQIGVLTIPSLKGKSIEQFSIAVADSLRLGRPTYNDGILITVALADRQMRIEVGTGLENIVKDEIAAQIIRDDMVPKFRQQNFGAGIYAAVGRICQLIREHETLVGQPPK